MHFKITDVHFNEAEYQKWNTRGGASRLNNAMMVYLVPPLSRRQRVGLLLPEGTRCFQMWAQLVQCTLDASTPTLHRKRPARPRLQWVQVWTATLVPAQVRFSLTAEWRRWLLGVFSVTCVFSGVSLRILSADSDGLSNGVLSSALEWDYYDPCYVKQNQVPKHKRPRPAVHTKQYWV